MSEHTVLLGLPVAHGLLRAAPPGSPVCPADLIAAGLAVPRRPSVLNLLLSVLTKFRVRTGGVQGNLTLSGNLCTLRILKINKKAMAL